MNDLLIARLSPKDGSAWSELLTADHDEYRRYFIPFATDGESLAERLQSAREDRYWGLWFGGKLAGFFMMRGFDEGYKRPSFGVYIARSYSGMGLSKLALEYCMNWCRLNGIDAMMLKVHPDNRYALRTYKKAGFNIVGTCERTGHAVMEKRWESGS